MRLALAAVALVLAAAPGRAQEYDSETNKNMMLAAAVVLSDASQHFGQLIIDGPDKAHFSDNSAFFFRKSQCRYSQYSPISPPMTWFEIIDFRAVTGDFSETIAYGNHSLLLEGASPQTRCFQFQGQTGYCVPNIRMTVSPDEMKRVLDDVAFLKTHCRDARKTPY